VFEVLVALGMEPRKPRKTRNKRVARATRAWHRSWQSDSHRYSGKGQKHRTQKDRRRMFLRSIFLPRMGAIEVLVALEMEPRKTRKKRNKRAARRTGAWPGQWPFGFDRHSGPKKMGRNIKRRKIEDACFCVRSFCRGWSIAWFALAIGSLEQDRALAIGGPFFPLPADFAQAVSA
jgi:hypothetical protein